MVHAQHPDLCEKFGKLMASGLDQEKVYDGVLAVV